MTDQKPDPDPKPGVPLEKVRWIVSAAFLVVSTLPILLVLGTIFFWHFHENSLVIQIFGAPNAPALYGAYILQISSALLGNSFLAALRSKRGESEFVTYGGIAVLSYSAFIIAAGLPTVLLLSNADVFGSIQHAASAQAAGQLLSYASWTVSTCIAVFASILGISQR